MNDRSSRHPPGQARSPVAVAAQEHRGTLMVEALVAACAVVSHADGRSSPIERWRLSTVLADDPLFAALPPGIAAGAGEAQRRAFRADPAAARAAALKQVARLAADAGKARMVFDACVLVIRADEQAPPAEIQALLDVKAALGL